VHEQVESRKKSSGSVRHTPSAYADGDGTTATHVALWEKIRHRNAPCAGRLMDGVTNGTIPNDRGQAKAYQVRQVLQAIKLLEGDSE
jgi:hypothetical protein